MPDKDSLGELMVAEALSRIDIKLERIDERLDDQGKIMVHQQAILDEHVRRSDLLEQKIEMDVAATKAELPRAIDERLKAKAEELTEKRKKQVIFILKLGGGIAGLSTGGFGFMHLLKWLSSLVGG